MPYLSTAPPPRRNQKHARVASDSKSRFGPIPAYVTDTQREDIDRQCNSYLRDIGASISALNQACNLRHETAQRRLQQSYGKSSNFLMRWAAGSDESGQAGKSDEQIDEENREWTIDQFRRGVLEHLNHWYKLSFKNVEEMVRIRTEREEEKLKSSLSDARNRNIRLSSAYDDLAESNIDTLAHDTYNPALDVNGGAAGPELTPEQLQLFEEENDSLMKHYNDTLTQVTQTEKSLMEIQSLQTTIAQNLETQGNVIADLVLNADRTDENVTRGNKELKRASEKTRWPKYMYHVTLYLCAGLVVWDLIF